MPTTIIIPTKQEKFLNQTILDIVQKARSDIEIIAVLDGYDPDELISGVNYIRLPASDSNQMRHAINEAVKQAKYEHIMKIDAHCMLMEGFDTVLERDCEDDWVMVPRRLRLDANNWCLIEDERPPVDYEYWKYREFKKGGMHGYRWDSRTIERKDILIDDILDFQGSCYFMHKDWFNKMGFLKTEGFGGFGQESTEISLNTWFNGGRVKVNKQVWYAHLHKGKVYGRMYNLNWKEVRASEDYSYNYFVNDNREKFVELVNRFMPIPKWEKDWEKRL